MKLIPKDAVLAVIDKFKHEGYIPYDRGVFELVCDIESDINSLEEKEVDLEKEINKYTSDNYYGSETLGFFANRTDKEPDGVDIVLCAKHFFELGVNASNPLTWEDIKLIWNITDEMDNMPEEEFYKEVLKRFKAQKGK